MGLTYNEKNNVGVIVFDHDDSKVNILSSDVIKQLSAALDQLKDREDLTALLIVSMKKDVFIAGADIKEIEKIVEPDDGAKKAKAGQDVLNKIEELHFPTIAVIDGVALGGGCELALACDYRLATFNPKVRIGLPEVNLGFIPGFGGTYRLPRIVGLQEALKMILAGRPIDGAKALKIGLFDKIVTQKGLDQHIEEFVKDITEGKLKKSKYERRKKKKGFPGFLDHNPIGNRIVFDQSRKNVLKLTKGFYPAPLKAVDVVASNFYMDRKRGLALEARGFGELAVTDISKNLVYIFYLSEKYRKLSIKGTESIKPANITKCGVLGAGVMGGGIAQLLSSKGIWTRMKDISLDAIAKGFQAAGKVYTQAVKKRKLTKAVAAERMAHITGSLDYSGFANADYVIEAVVENMDIKKSVFKELSEKCSEHTILASNTSALSVTEMSLEVKDPSKVIGFHFFNPVHRMPLVEIITTAQTSNETLVTSLALVKRLGKTPIVVKDSPGFIVNRILLGYICEAGHILEETGELEEVDLVMTDFGMPMGPFLLSDEVGLDVGLKVMHILEESFGKRFKAASIFEKILETGKLGKKSGKGFYDHTIKDRQVNTEVWDLMDSQFTRLDKQECLDRLVLTMINEAAKCLEEKIVEDPGAIDVGMIFGTGFPPFKGGLLKYADSLGIAHVVDQLEKLQKELEAERFAPCQYLLNLKNQNKTFFAKD